MNKLALVPGGVDAAVIDMGLPDRGGDALVREIRALYPSLPVVLATGLSASHLRNVFKDEQRIAFVTKPYSRSSLLNALHELGIKCEPDKDRLDNPATTEERS
jgi:CheY-like chemotaxis protein